MSQNIIKTPEKSEIHILIQKCFMLVQNEIDSFSETMLIHDQNTKDLIHSSNNKYREVKEEIDILELDLESLTNQIRRYIQSVGFFPKIKEENGEEENEKN